MPIVGTAYREERCKPAAAADAEEAMRAPFACICANKHSETFFH